MLDSPSVIIKIELIKFDPSGNIIIDIDITGRIVEGFRFIQYEGLAPSQVSFKIIDYTWELSQYLNLFKFNPGEFLRVRFSFGFSRVIWFDIEGNPEPAMTPPLLATVTQFIPTFTEAGIEVTIICQSIALEKVLKTVNNTYAPPAGTKTVQDLLRTVAADFSINLVIDGSMDEVLISDSRDLKADPKTVAETGIDYLARLYAKYSPRINGRPTFARFNPFSQQGEGSFEIKPEGNSFIKRVYRYNGIDSKIVEFTPSVENFSLEKKLQSVQVSSINDQTKETDLDATPNLGTDDIEKKRINNATPDLLKSIALNIQNSYFKKINRAVIKVIGDVSIFRGDLVQVEVYNKLNGALIMASTWWITGLEHSLDSGMIYTTMELVPSDVSPIIARLQENSNEFYKFGLDQAKEQALKQESELFSKLTGFTKNFISGVDG